MYAIGKYQCLSSPHRDEQKKKSSRIGGIRRDVIYSGMAPLEAKRSVFKILHTCLARHTQYGVVTCAKNRSSREHNVTQGTGSIRAEQAPLGSLGATERSSAKFQALMACSNIWSHMYLAK